MRLSAYPYVLVRIGCDRCGRFGRYRLARLAAKYGPEATTDTVIDALTRDCRYRADDSHRRPIPGACRARMLDARAPPPPPDLPPATTRSRAASAGVPDR